MAFSGAKEDQRNAKIRDICLFSIMMIVCVYVPLTNWEEVQCPVPKVRWLIIQAFFYFLYALKSSVQLWHIYYPISTKRIFALKLFYFYIINVLQISWFIYGNTFHYSVQSQTCKRQSDNELSLWILMTVNLCIGYAFLASFLFLGTILLCFLCLNGIDNENTES
jgi:hypothetical protein